MIDDSPYARLMVVIFFAGFILACAPIGYYLADVERYPINHARILSLKKLQSDYFVTLTIHSETCLLSHEVEKWSSDKEIHKSFLSIFQATHITSYNKSLPTTEPSNIIHALDLEQPTIPHEMNVVLLAVPDITKYKRLLYLGPTRRSIAYISCSGKPLDISDTATQLHNFLGTDRTKHTDVVSVPEYRISMTLLDSKPTNRQLPVTWSGDIMRASLQPFLLRMQTIMNMDVDTQIVRFAKISERVYKSCGRNCKKQKNTSYFVTPKDLQRIRSLLSEGFTLESSAVSPLVSPLHLILYLPPSSETPLYIVPSKKVGIQIDIEREKRNEMVIEEEDDDDYERNRLGFFVPRYGGIVVWNLQDTAKDCNSSLTSSCSPSELVLDVTSDLWVSQLRHVFGVPTEVDVSEKVSCIRSQFGISDWELDSLARTRMSHFGEQTMKSLQSLSTLVQDMSHMAVPEQVSVHVLTSLEQYNNATKILADTSRDGGGDKVVRALEMVSKAFNSARQAEMNPTMAPLRYFPPEHLAAVYLPLILPLLLPIICGLKTGIREYKNDDRKDTA
jgi:hypothetical protein